MSWKRFTHFCICRENDLRTFVYVMKTIYFLFAHMSRKNLRISSGKFLRVKVCRLESWDFLGLCVTPRDGTGSPTCSCGFGSYPKASFYPSASKPVRCVRFGRGGGEVVSGYSILMDPGLFSHDQEGMGRNMESNDVSGSSIFLIAG